MSVAQQIEVATTKSSAEAQSFVEAEKLFDEAKDVKPTESSTIRDDLHRHETNSSSKSKFGRKKCPSKEGSRSYFLRSADSGALISRLNETAKPPEDANLFSSQPAVIRRRGRKKKQQGSASINEIVRIRNRVKGLISRMHYEQSLIEAYSGEGWNRKSLDKVKPEKEIKRAASEILKCKMKIRDSFKDLDSLCAEGKHQESLFDSEGQIYSEDIFCAKCRLKDLYPDNDIILCDGVCDRGFHQMCLDPPLLKEQIPPGDEIWLCPGCDCKLDLITSLNQYQGANLSIEDHWEKIFPEAAVHGDGTRQSDDLGLPSDDSEDTDYDPDNPDPEEIDKEGSSSEESDFTSDSSGSSHDKGSFDKIEGLEFSDSSEAASQPTEDSKGSGEKETVVSIAEFSTPISWRRHLERLDYKKLYDEAYGGLPSDSSDDGDYCVDSETFEDVDVGPSEKTTGFHDSQNIQDIESGKQTKMPERKPRKKCMLPYEYSLTGVSVLATRNGQKKRTHEQLEVQGDKPQDVLQKPRPKMFTLEACKRLYESLRESQYPTRQTKENLANELGVEVKRVTKWFEHARKCIRVAVSTRLNENSKAFDHLDDAGQSRSAEDGNQERKTGPERMVEFITNTCDINDQMDAPEIAGQSSNDPNEIGCEENIAGNAAAVPAKSQESPKHQAKV